MLSNGVENQSKLTNKSTNNRYNLGSFATETINIKHFLEYNALFSLCLFDKLLLNHETKLFTLICTASSFTGLTTLDLCFFTSLFFLFGLFLSILFFLFMSGDSGLMCSRNIVNVAVHHLVLGSISLVK